MTKFSINGKYRSQIQDSSVTLHTYVPVMENCLVGLASPFGLGLLPSLWILELLQTSTHHMLKVVITNTLIQDHHSNQAMKLTWIHRECIVRSRSSSLVKVFKLKRFIFRCIDIQINVQTSVLFSSSLFLCRAKETFFPLQR